MSVAFKRCQELTRQDGLNIFLKKKDGSPKNAAEIFYNIYDFTSGIEILLPPADRIPQSPAVGEYFAAFRIPPDANVGKYRIRWKFREYLNSKQAEVLQEFAIIGESSQVVTIPGVTPTELDLIRGLRIMLRDSRPDRNYHFVPPAGEESINQFTRVFGYLWLDDELKEFLRVSLDAINSYAPQTFYDTLDQLILQHKNWRTLLFTGAMVHSINALALNWVADEFSLAPDTEVTVYAEGFSISVSIEYLYEACVGEKTGHAIRYAYQSGCLMVESVHNGEISVKPISKILKHSTSHKRAFKITADGFSVITTEDHSLFDNNMKSIAARDLLVGQEIIRVHGGKIDKMTVSNIQEVDPLITSYDLSVPGPENFVLSNGILAHNSYSIGGVSLDVEKSAKYQSMANDAQTRFSDMVVATKETVKVIRGLKQSRYGLGIRSSFGPSVGRGALTPRRFLGI